MILGREHLAERFGSFVPDQPALLLQPPFKGLPAQIDHMRGCKCTRGHAYRSCPRFIEHFWAWLTEGAAKNDVCTCPPTDEALLMLGCPMLGQHLQVCSYRLMRWPYLADNNSKSEPNKNPPLSGPTEVTGQCSCPTAGNYISARCSLYREHLMSAWKGKARSDPKNPLICSCARNPDLVSRSCLLCIEETLQLEVRHLPSLNKHCYIVLTMASRYN